jgi:hypothetical protein
MLCRRNGRAGMTEDNQLTAFGSILVILFLVVPASREGERRRQHSSHRLALTSCIGSYDSAPDRWGKAMPTLRVNGYDMAFAERGTGALLLLVHGTLCDYRHWTGQMKPFGAHYAQSPSVSGIAGQKNGTAMAMISPCSNTRAMSRASLPRCTRDRFICLVTPVAGISLFGRRRIILISSARSSSLSQEARWRRISRQVLGRLHRRSRWARSTQRRPNEFGAARSTTDFRSQLIGSPGLAVGTGRQNSDGGCFATTPPPCLARSRSNARHSHAPTPRRSERRRSSLSANGLQRLSTTSLTGSGAR